MNRHDEAFKILKKMARINKSKIFLEETAEQSLKLDKNENLDEKEETSSDVFKGILCSKNNLLKLAGLFIIWNSLNLNYVGVSLGIISTLPINPYLMFLLSAIFELIGAWASFIGDKIGRKKLCSAHF